MRILQNKPEINKEDQTELTSIENEIIALKNGMNIATKLINDIHVTMKSLFDTISEMDKTFLIRYRKVYLRTNLAFYMANKDFALKHATAENVLYINQYFNSIIENIKKDIQRQFPEQFNQILTEAEAEARTEIELSQNAESNRIDKMPDEAFTKV